MSTRLLIALAAALAACSVHADFNGAPFACGNGDTCPSGTTCQGGYCLPPTSDGGSAGPEPCGALLAVGPSHACAVDSVGVMSCWGENEFGELGDGSDAPVDHDTPIAVAGGQVGSATAIALGDHHSCAIVGGLVWCWGHNADGQLGTQGTLDESAPVQALAAFPDVSPPSAIAAGAAHSCAILKNGDVWCWGAGSAGQIGSGVVGSGPGQAQLPMAATAIVANGDSTCALLSNFTVACWGANTGGQLGLGGSDGSAHPTPTVVADVAGATAIALGSAHACALVNGSEVTCWGTANAGQLGDGSGSGSAFAPVTAALPVAATAITAGADHTCALDGSGNAWCWGDDTDDELADGGFDHDSFAPTRAALLGDVAAVAAGAFYTCALDTDRAIICAGNGAHGRLGNAPPIVETAPVALPGSDFVAVAAGSAHTCAAHAAGPPTCWGDNRFGQLGDGTTAQSDVPVATLGLGPASAISSVADHTCALVGSAAACWGDNTFGQLGDGTTAARSVANVVALPGPVVQVAAGGAHSCAVLASKSFYCWGDDASGQLGNNSNTSQTLPVQGQGQLDSIALGLAHGCGTSGANLFCWGDNSFQQLNITGGSFNTPQGAESGVSAYALGADFTCATTGSNTQVVCWGADDAGQLGNGMIQTSATNQTVAGMTGVTALWAGARTACARKGSDGSTWCWGDGSDGQLGDGGFDVATLPEQVALGSGALAIGQHHACVLGANQTLACYGSDRVGQLGDGVSALPLRAVALSCPAQ